MSDQSARPALTHGPGECKNEALNDGTKTPDTDPQERADFEAVLRHAFHREALDPEVLRRVHERSARAMGKMERLHGIIDDATFQELIRDGD